MTNGSSLVGTTVGAPVKSDKPAKPDDKKMPKKTSLLTVILLCLLLVGIGGIIGYLVFSSVYNHRCSDLMDDAERHFNSTEQDLHNRLIEAQHKNAESEIAELELRELRGRMESHTDLMSKHEGLLDKHQRTMEQLTAVQYSQEQTLLIKKRLEHDLDIAQAKLTTLERSLEKANRDQGSLGVQLKRSQDMIANLSRQNEELAMNASCEEEKAVATSQIQELHLLLSKQSFGEGPYYLKFSLSVEDEPDDENNAFIVEITTLHQLPNVVFSFMTLQKAKVYDGVEFLPTNSIVYVGSDEKTFGSFSHVKSALSRAETTAVGDCKPYSVGFVGGDTGGLKLVMTRDSSKHGSLACFGTIVHGRQFISRIQMSPQQGKTMSIRTVEQVLPQAQEGEL